MNRAAFEKEFLLIQPFLKSFLYRITCDRDLAEDLSQETFLKCLAAIESFQNKCSLKTWIFTVAKNLAFDNLRARKRFSDDSQDKCRTSVESHPEYREQLETAFHDSPEKRFEIREHINFCFNCLAKTLNLEEQIAVILADIYDFKRAEIAEVLDKSEGVVKHLLFNGRKSLQEKYENRCVLVGKGGICYQCAELSRHYNSPQETVEQLSNLTLSPALNTSSKALLKLRTELIKTIDPLKNDNRKFHDTVMQILDKVEE